MQVWAILRKDIVHQFRSGFSLIVMFVAPLLVTGLIYVAFGGGASSTPQIAQIRVQVANLDSGANGAQLVKALQSDQLHSLLQVTLATDEPAARAAVTGRQADVAVVIPADFTQNPATATITLAHDPAMTIAPQIVESVLSQYLDIVNGARIAAQTTGESFASRGITVDLKTAQGIAEQYVVQHSQAQSLLAVEALSKPQSRPQSTMIATIFASMMIFFMFFTGAQVAQSIIVEEEQGTLARLFTTSVQLPSMLIGKLGAACLTLAVQAIILLGSSALLFGLQWGDPLAMVLLVAAQIVACAGFGVLIIAFIKNARQAGTIIGGALTLTGLLGGLFSGVLPDSPAFISASSLVLPQGWAMKGWQVIVAGGTAGDILAPAAALLVIAAICFVVANFKLQKRFA